MISLLCVLIHDSTTPSDSPNPFSCVTKPLPPFPNRLKGKKVLSHINKTRETLSQVKIDIRFLDEIQQMPPYAYFLKHLCTTKRATNVRKMTFLASSVSLIISNQVPLTCKDPGCPTISIVIGHHSIHWAFFI